VIAIPHTAKSGPSHTNPKRKRGNVLRSSLALRVSVGSGRERYAQRIAICLITLSMIVTGGCAKKLKTYPVKGKVTFKDGSPLTKGWVEFEPVDAEDKVNASGEIQADGTFVLGTLKTDDGAVAGRHRVIVVVQPDVGTGPEDVTGARREIIAARFRSYDTSGLEFTVEPKPNEFPIEVEPAP
jgi:hypothetical protein